jgi:hypothetical protein
MFCFCVSILEIDLILTLNLLWLDHSSDHSAQDNVEEWSVDNVCNWVKSLGEAYEKYVPAFRSFGVDGQSLLGIENEDDLKNELGIEGKLIRKKIWSLIDSQKQ